MGQYYLNMHRDHEDSKVEKVESDYLPREGETIFSMLDEYRVTRVSHRIVEAKSTDSVDAEWQKSHERLHENSD